ncbi:MULTISPECIES: toxin VasX [Pseudomonas]|uniref:toxin VasX n=1 Tax=Pseudomonas TaxID=286 RepID=UPI0030028AF6
MSNTNPNDVDARTNDAKSAMAECPLMKEKVQLLPLRYGLVERLDPSSAIKPPYTLKSRPLGVRLIRDGWLYIIDNSTGYLHEYSVTGGAITKRLWQGTEASQDQREGGEGDSILLFPRLSRLHVAYSEVQWTARKCSQMIGSVEEREHFMQVVNLSSADPIAGATHLLTERQAKQWIAEVAEPASTEPLPEGANVEEGQDYVWENQTLFQKTQIGTVKNQLQGAFQTDHLYLVFEDNIGVLRDLAQEQDTVVGWIDDWRSNEDTELKYMVGSYIENLMVLGEQNVQSAGASDNFQNKTTPQQRQTVYDYVNATNDLKTQASKTSEVLYPAFTLGGQLKGSPETQVLQADADNKKQAMQAAFGDALYDELGDDIDAMQDSTHASLEGKGLGARGINDLVRYEEMNQYLEAERAGIKRWTQRLDLITEDRTLLFTTGEFHRSAWYFDTSVSAQFEAKLATEFNCVRDLCRTGESLEAVGEYFHVHPEYILPAYNGVFGGKAATLIKLLDNTRKARASIESANLQITRVEALMGSHWTRNLHLSPQERSLSIAVAASYSPAIALRLNQTMADLETKLNSPGLSADLEKLETHSNRGQRLAGLLALKQEGATLQISSEAEIKQFKLKLNELNRLLGEEDSLLKERNFAKNQSKKFSSTAEIRRSFLHEKQLLNNKIFLVRQQRTALTNQLGDSIITTNTASAVGALGLKVKLTAAQKAMFDDEIGRIQRGAWKGYGEGGAAKSVLKGGWLPLGLMLWQSWSLGDAWRTWSSIQAEGVASVKQNIVFLGALTAPVASALSIYQGAHIVLVNTAFGSLQSAHDNKAGMLFAVKMGRLGLGVGMVIAPLFMTSAIATAWNNADKWITAIKTGTTGEQVGASIAIAGDMGYASLSTAITLRGLRDLAVTGWEVVSVSAAERAGVMSLAWSTRGLRFTSFLARSTPWGLGLTVAQVLGEALYNYYHLDDTQRWMLNGCWGNEAQWSTWEEHAQALAEATLKPVVIDKGFDKAPDHGGVRPLLLCFPGVTPESLKAQPMTLSMDFQRGNLPPEDATEAIINELCVVSTVPLVLRFDVPEHWCGVATWLHLRVAVQPTLASTPLNQDDNFLFYAIPLDYMPLGHSKIRLGMAGSVGKGLRAMNFGVENLHVSE